MKIILNRYKDKIIGYAYKEIYDLEWKIETYAVIYDDNMFYIPIKTYDNLDNNQYFKVLENLLSKGYGNFMYWYEYVRNNKDNIKVLSKRVEV